MISVSLNEDTLGLASQTELIYEDLAPTSRPLGIIHCVNYSPTCRGARIFPRTSTASTAFSDAVRAGCERTRLAV